MVNACSQSVRLSMKILLVAGPLHREYGGVPQAVTGVASSLATLGHEIKLVVCGQSIKDSHLNSFFFDKLKKSGSEVQIYIRSKQSKYGSLLKFKEVKSLWNDMAKSDFIVLHQVFQLQYLALFFVLLLNGKPFAVMPHGTLTEYQRKQHRLRKFVFKLPTYAFLKSANGIFVATMQELEQLPKYLKEKGLIVGLGIEPQDKQSISKLIPPRIFSLLYMGRLAKKKRLDIALRAFALAKKDSQIDMNFIVCGTGEVNEITELKELVESLGIEKVVDFRGWVDSTEKQSVFFESSCFILTSEDENFAIAAAEALSYGIPCILSANVALASLVAKYNAGVVFQEITPNEIAQAIIKISTGDREVCKRLSLLASSELDWDVVAKQWESAIKSLVRQ